MAYVPPPPPVNPELEKIRHCPMCNCRSITKKETFWTLRRIGICNECGLRAGLEKFYRTNPFGTLWIEDENLINSNVPDVW